MPYFITLGKWTEQGIRTVKASPKRAEDARKWAEQHGGKLQVFYTFGEYDFVALGEMPNDETALEFALTIGGQGNARTTTLKAWSVQDGSKVFGRLK
ncbi:MAG: GYD domain-containing protein [Nitrososphaerales archaeon]|nr:GYD domain-containing protein [Nitrososphaerales archaeon]